MFREEKLKSFEKTKAERTPFAGPESRVAPKTVEKSKATSVIGEMEWGILVQIDPVLEQTGPGIVMSGRSLFSL
jgi:hypothetical protein